jgi:hypothetical protein
MSATGYMSATRRIPEFTDPWHGIVDDADQLRENIIFSKTITTGACG